MNLMHGSSISISGFSIAYKTWGASNLPPLIALHGWLDNANSFDLLAPYLAEHFHLLAIDLPGHGFSSHLPEGCHYHFIDGIFSILEIIKALGIEQVHLLGHSMGACLASLVAGIAPQQIISLALLEGLGPFASPEASCRDQLEHYAHKLLKSSTRTAKLYPTEELAALARAKNGYLSLEHAKILCQRGLEKKGKEFYWRHDRRLLTANPLRMTERQVLSCLQGISAPSCLVWADKGFAFHEQIMQGRVKTVKNLITYHLQGGHHIHMEQPEAVAGCLKDFYTARQVI